MFIRTLRASQKFPILLQNETPFLSSFQNQKSHRPSERPSAKEILEILTGEEQKKRFGYELFGVAPVRMPQKVDAREILTRLPGKDIFSLWKLSSSDLYR